MSGGRERRVHAGELPDGDAAVGLMADDDDDAAAVERRPAHRVRGGAGREPVVDFRLAEAERGRGLARAAERARQDCVGFDAGGAEPVAEPARLLAPAGRERPELVRVARSGLGVSDDDESHGRGGG